MENFFNLFFNQKCLICRKSIGPLCPECLQKSTINYDSFCLKCGGAAVGGKTHLLCAQDFYLNEIFSCFEYEGVVRECIKASKYSRRKFVLLKRLLDFYFESSRFCPEFKDFVICSVPLHPQKLKIRGYNQADILSQELSRMLKIPFVSDLVIRNKETIENYKKNRKSREESLKGVFELNPVFSCSQNSIPDRILIVDDICTTGSTLNQIAKVLNASGCKYMVGFTLARTIYRL
mgnify:CR=1 FL=1